ncbi:glycosyltransferase [Nocardioides sp. SR21]|uniref:glycosyltransferase n=1 Tax=Nocardioides sp. SR21 TaxID=2919501 RepID=UPI001FA96D64|nr:glycosyltransferase [Nocardioides sp. SR21]
MSGPRILVVTVVHHPEDARIRHRQIDALLAAGWDVTYAAPFTGYGVTPDPRAGLTTVDLPRARGRRRLSALRTARDLLRRSDHDLVLLHDPELTVAARGLDLPPVVWDVHEDAAATMHVKPWLPSPLAGPAASAVRRLERSAEERMHLLLAEEGYRPRFHREHPVVPNTTRVPETVRPPDDPRVVYVGHLTRARGVFEMAELGALLRTRSAGQLRVQLIGHADAEATELLTTAPPGVEWLGFRPHAEAMRIVDGALAGLSLLHDEPNYRVSQPTKVVEYLAHGVPVVTTPLPRAAELVQRTGGGLVVPFGDARAAAGAVLELARDRHARTQMSSLGHAYAGEHLDWDRHSRAFVEHLGELSAAAPTSARMVRG